MPIDIVAFPYENNPANPKELGFSKILDSSQIEILSQAGPITKPFLISTTNPNLIYTLLKSNKCMGLLYNGEEIDPKTLNKLKENEKLLLFNYYYLAISPRDRISKVHKMRKLFREAYKSKTKIGLITLARNENYVLSSLQLFEVAKMLSTDEHQAKKIADALEEST